jgi:sterol desaturase/sphingolipid hydroxylase (fatty acid hydroxylase superfamily)
MYRAWADGPDFRTRLADYFCNRDGTAMAGAHLFCFGSGKTRIFADIIFIPIQSLLIHCVMFMASDFGWMRSVVVTPHDHHGHRPSDEGGARPKTTAPHPQER